MIVICKFCKQEFDYKNYKEKPRYGLFYHREFYVCKKCYVRELQPKKICLGCNRELVIVNKKDQLCVTCNHKTKEKKYTECSSCGKIAICHSKLGSGKYICRSCYKQPERECDICHNIGKITKNNNGISYCHKCYGREFRHHCSICGRLKIIAKRRGNEKICVNCRRKELRAESLQYRMKSYIRNRFADAIRAYTKDKKLFSIEEYGIKIEDIIKKLGPCPGERGEFHIDHHFPLAAFDLTNIEQVKAAFAPENHVWLKKEDNLRKHDKYNEEEFEEYLKKHNIERKQ